MELESNSNIENEIIDSEQPKFISYKYRWVVLIMFMFAGAMTQVIWITFMGISKASAEHYNVSANLILLLSLIFMIVYIPVNFLACWTIDKFGLKWGTGIGVILTGVFGFLRAVSGTNYWLLFFFQFMTAVGQPFVLNSFTKLAANWFPEKERTLASGLGTIAMLIGVIIAFVTAQPIIGESPYKMDLLLYIFGGAALLSMVLYLIFVRDKPPTPANSYSDKTKVLAVKGTFSMFKKRDFTLLFVVLFVGLGAFNALSSVLDIVYDYPVDSEIPGFIGGTMIGGGIIGAILLSSLSDKYKKRKIFIIIAMFAGAILTPIMILVPNMYVHFIIAFIFGFFLVSALPVGLTFAAEITYPLPEETSNGLMMWIGQIGGIILLGCIMITNWLGPAYMYINIIIIAVTFVIGIVMSFLMKDLDAYELKSQ
jgi:sugar phosphate permease